MGYFALDLGNTVDSALDAAIANLKLWRDCKDADYLLRLVTADVKTAMYRLSGGAAQCRDCCFCRSGESLK